MIPLCTYTCRVRMDAICAESGDQVPVYGIEAVSPEGEVLSAFPDLFFDREQAEQLVYLCNTNGVSLNQLADVAEDALVGQYIIAE